MFRLSSGKAETVRGAAENKQTEIRNPQTRNLKLHNPHSAIEDSAIQNPNSELSTPNSELIKLVPLGANKTPEIIAAGLHEGKVNYLIGNDPEKWKTNIPTYSAVVYKDIYKNIDMRFYGNNRQMEYDIIVTPGANPSRVRFAYRGIEDLRVTDEGDLEIYLKGGKLVQKKPYVYQVIDGKKVETEGKFVTRGREPSSFENTKITDTKSGHGKRCIYGFQVASYDKRYPLIIDPALVYSTYLGGSGFDTGRGIAVDTSGNAYVTGQTVSTDFPTAAAIFRSIAESPDAFVTKLNASGNALVYSTYLGGSDVDAGMGIAVDTSVNAYVTGFTESADFPIVSAIYGNNAGLTDVFVTKLNASGNALVYSTYLGGSGNEILGFLSANGGIAVDTTGNAYVTGQTESTDFPTFSAIYGSKAGVSDAFVTKLNDSGNALVYSTYLGGNAQDLGNGIAVDTSGNVYVTGLTVSTDFPTFSAIYGSKAGVSDAFVTKLNDSGNALVYSTYLGGNDGDSGFGIAVDTSGNAYVTGFTGSTDFPTASAIYGNNAGLTDAFITKINASGSSLVFSTYLGGSIYDAGNGIAIDTSGDVYVTGQTESPDFPTASAIYGSYAGDDAFITKIKKR